MNLGNCPRCGKLYQLNVRNLCPDCIKEIDKEYETCADKLRKTPGLSIYELSDETGVSTKQITKFIREGRISIVNAPNMSYPCEVCGTLIRENNICMDCRQRLIKDVNSIKNRNQHGQGQGDRAYNTYKSGERDF
ncbi:flagellar protein [Paenibacillus sp. GCM10012307]|uniref:Flagellar protein n=1 Tax=Paenibacillus roseus TaxID=2798579 RepID=A0A934J584_9BACL|nr:flagellar protein [Paenibacillus roseus]MBJ6361924.1 flagellar protein [Paenibacillus roseus]